MANFAVPTGRICDTDSTLVRLAWLVGTVITGVVPGMLAYIVAAVIMPKPTQK